jgi:membrane protein YqaA with SNARE-associated domain
MPKKKKGKREGLFQILLAVLIVLAVLLFSRDIEALTSYGYIGVFFIAMLSTATIIFPSPGWAALIAMSPFLDPVLLGIAAGIGAAVGEMTGFLAGDGAREILRNHVKESKGIEETVRKYGLWGIFVLSFVPNPLFDVAGLVAGGLKMQWWQFLLACAAGRVLRYVLVAIVGGFTLGLFL